MWGTYHGGCFWIWGRGSKLKMWLSIEQSDRWLTAESATGMFTARSAKRAAARGSRLAPGSVRLKAAADQALILSSSCMQAPCSLQLEPTQWSCWCFGKARPLTPYQAAALGNLAGSVLHCLEHCSAWRCWLAYRAGPSRPDVSLPELSL